MNDFLTECTESMLRQAKALKGSPIALLVVVVDEFGEQLALAFTETDDDGLDLARDAADAASYLLADLLHEGDRVTLEGKH